ncbi:MAG: hypothetical protein EOM68_27770, partial [Spirochaetia bacterium]|nr:hypothetical protein [Spirochaetia bacterium]
MVGRVDKSLPGSAVKPPGSRERPSGLSLLAPKTLMITAHWHKGKVHGQQGATAPERSIMFIHTISSLSETTETFKTWNEVVEYCHSQGHAVIVTHDDKFHADEVLASALIIKLCPEDFVVLRTRALPTNLSDKDWIVDVGGGPYDHHEKDRETYKNGVKKAACGKVAEVLLREDPKTLEKLQRTLLWAVEAQDNGQSLQ